MMEYKIKIREQDPIYFNDLIILRTRNQAELSHRHFREFFSARPTSQKKTTEGMF